MAREMTPQERAAQMIKELFSLHLDDNGEADITDIAAIVDLVQATRRAALLEAAQVAEKRKNDSALGRVRDAYSYVEANLRKLAQEG